MILDNFREEYRRAVEELPKLHMESERVQDEIHHRRVQQKRRYQMIAKGCTAAAVLLLFGVGTVAAKDYVGGIIQVRENGYTVTGGEERMMARSGTGEAETEEGAFDSGVVALFGVEECDDSYSVEAVVSESEEYESFREFLENSSVTAKIPDICLLESEVEEASVSVIDDSMMTSVSVIGEGKYFNLTQTDYRGVESYSSATGYTGRTENERSFINSQGLCYTLFDTVDDDGQTEAIHGVILVEGRELSMSFRGFETEAVEKILKNLDLTMYFAE